MGLAQNIAAAASSFWGKITALWNKDVAPALTEVEAEVLQILQPLFGQFEASALAAVIAFIKGILAAAPTSKGVAEWEVVIIQLAEVAGGTIWSTVKGLSGNALQSLIALVLADLESVAAAKAASAPAAE